MFIQLNDVGYLHIYSIYKELEILHFDYQGKHKGGSARQGRWRADTHRYCLKRKRPHSCSATTQSIYLNNQCFDSNSLPQSFDYQEYENMALHFQKVAYPWYRQYIFWRI